MAKVTKISAQQLAEQKHFLDLEGLQILKTEIDKSVDKKDAETLKQAKEYSNSLSTNYDPAGTAQTKVDALEKGQVTTNKTAIETLKTSKADKSTTLSGYGITNAFTKDETKTEITTAIANADHLKREIVEQLPELNSADENTIYMLKKESSSGNNQYDEYMIVVIEDTRKLEKIGDSAVDLTNYATKEEVSIAKQEAITSATSTASADATSKSNKALQDAKTYSDGLAKNYATAVQGTKADSALQKESISQGSTNGSISVGGTDIKVKGLGSAAYAESTSFDSAGTAANAVKSLEDGKVATNTSDITLLKEKVLNLEEGNAIGTITREEIIALFA